MQAQYIKFKDNESEDEEDEGDGIAVVAPAVVPVPPPSSGANWKRVDVGHLSSEALRQAYEASAAATLAAGMSAPVNPVWAPLEEEVF